MQSDSLILRQSSRDRFLVDAFYSIGFLSVLSSITVTFLEILTGSGWANVDASAAIKLSFFSATFWDHNENTFVVLGVVSFAFFVLAFERLPKKNKTWLYFTAYGAIIIGSPDVFRGYDMSIWGFATELDEIGFAMVALMLLLLNLRVLLSISRENALPAVGTSDL